MSAPIQNDVASASADRGAPRAAGWSRGALLWLALLFAFSPALVDLGQHLRESPWARYALVFPALFARCALRERGALPERADGVAWILAGFGIELLGIVSGALRWGRVGLLLACIGLCRRFGYASSAALLLLLFAIPLPAGVLKLVSPDLSRGLFELAGAALGGVGIEVAVGPYQALRDGHALVRELGDEGLPLAALMAGLAWYAALLARRRPAAALLRAGLAALAALPVQLAAIALALAALPLVGDAAARAGLTHLPWIAVAVAGVAAAESRARAEASA